MAKKRKRIETNRTTHVSIAKNIMMFKERKGEIDHYESVYDLVNSIKKNPRRAIKLTKHLFNFGFIIDGNIYYIKASGIVGKHWTHGLDSVIERGEVIPRVYSAITNIYAKVQETLDQTKIDYESWMGSIWARKDEPEHGLYDATIARIHAYIHNQEKGIDYRYELSELRAVVTKLKGLLRVLEMQHSMVVAMIYHSKKGENIFQDAMGSMVSRVASDGADPILDFVSDGEENYSLDDSSKKKKKKKGKK